MYDNFLSRGSEKIETRLMEIIGFNDPIEGGILYNVAPVV
jgi:hypothetical protein